MSLPKQQLQQTQSQKPIVDLTQICKWISELPNPNTRENAMAELGRNRDLVQKFAPIFWHSFGVTATLLQEVLNVYWSLNSSITPYQLTRVSNALALLQCVASHPETRQKFIEADIPVYLYPFLKTTCKSKTFEYLRLTTLGVIGALVKTDEQYVITFLLQSEVTPLCLRIMENGSELSKTVATFIMQKILLNDNGLEYVCETHDRFSQVAMILGKIVITLVEEPSVRLLKHVIRCYSRLSDNFRAREALQQCLPDQLRDNTFMPFLAEDPQTQNILFTLQRNIDTPVVNPLFVIMQNNVANYPF